MPRHTQNRPFQEEPMTARTATPLFSILAFALLLQLTLFHAQPCAAADAKPAPAAAAAKPAASPPPAPPAPQVPQAQAKTDATPVAVELEGTDTLGAKLSFQLKEVLNSSTLFNLTDKDMPKLRVIVSTTPEFSSRPEVGSAYAVVWVYYERATAFTSYLASEVGTVSAEGVTDLATRLAERTSGLAAKYSYIFNK